MNDLYIVANWKMNGSQDFNRKLLSDIDEKIIINNNSHMIICPSNIFLKEVHLQMPSYMSIGAQNISQYSDGAYTGEVSGEMLADLNIEYVIIGHSERRELFKEDNNIVYSKLKKSILNNIKPIVCVGETIEHRDSGQMYDHIGQQLDSVLNTDENLNNLIIAYEPIWAIGTGKTATPEIAEEMHSYIRKLLAQANSNLAKTIPILYGGSVNSENAEKLFKMDNIDGALIGGASLKASEFSKIYNIAGELTNE